MKIHLIVGSGPDNIELFVFLTGNKSKLITIPGLTCTVELLPVVCEGTAQSKL